MPEYRVGILGHFGGGHEFLDGQTVKTKSIATQLKKTLGETQVMIADTYGGVTALPKCLRTLWLMLIHCKNVIILPAHNSVKIFPAFLVLCNTFFHRRLHYVVIGGWLPELTKRNTFLRVVLKKLDWIYVETSTMKRRLAEQGFKNIVILPNFKDIQILTKEELVYPTGEPYRLCTFSRVMKEKGIEDAVNAVKSINAKYGRTIFALDIYGQVNQGQIAWFEGLKAMFPPYIHYKGLVPFDKSVEVLKDYFALMFPTRFYTEGIPGTIIDAYAAGVPVIFAKWESFADVVNNGVTGIEYEFGNFENLLQVLERVAVCPNEITAKKDSCLVAADRYQPSTALQIILERI